MDYGTDFRLTDDDVVFTPDGDIETIFGPAMVAQDIDQTLKITLGRLPWDPEVGSSMPLMLNESGSDPKAVIAELERVAIADPRTNPEAVRAYETQAGKFRLEFTPLNAVTPEVLDFDLTKERKT